MSVVADEVDLVLPSDGREPHRPLGEEPPADLTRVGVERRHAIGDHRRHEHGLAHHDRLIRGVVSQPHLAGKRRTRRRQLANPPQRQLGRQMLRRSRAACRAKTKLRPIVGVERRGEAQARQGDNDELGWRGLHVVWLQRMIRNKALGQKVGSLEIRSAGDWEAGGWRLGDWRLEAGETMFPFPLAPSSQLPSSQSPVPNPQSLA